MYLLKHIEIVLNKNVRVNIRSKKEIESDDQVKSLAQTNEENNYEDIPLNILAKLIKESHNNERQENTKCNFTNDRRQTAENESDLKNDEQNDRQQLKKTSRFHQVDHLDHFKIVEKAVRMKNMLTIFNRGSKLIRERRRG